MGFICQSCGVAQPPRTKQQKVTVGVRTVRYPTIIDDETKRVIRTPEGFEPTQQINVCPDCFKKQFTMYNDGEKTIVNKEKEDVE